MYEVHFVVWDLYETVEATNLFEPLFYVLLF